MVLYAKYDRPVAVNVPMPSALLTVTSPKPPVVVGSVWKNTLMPSGWGVTPSGVPIARNGDQRGE